MSEVPIGSVKIRCPSCFYDEGFDLYEAVTDVGYPVNRYYAVCRKCRYVISIGERTR